MFGIPIKPPLDMWPLSLPDEVPWAADSASVLQPKALVQTPRYCQPPPSYRPRPPLFPVPPPGSCLLPPPPIALCEGVLSPHSWNDQTPSRTDKLRKLSWTVGDGGSSSSSPPIYYNYQKQGQARTRTLIEVPIQAPPLTSAVSRSDPQPIQAKKVVNVSQSTLDPTSRPFTPASFQSHASSAEDVGIPYKNMLEKNSLENIEFQSVKVSSKDIGNGIMSTTIARRQEPSFQFAKESKYDETDSLPEEIKALSAHFGVDISVEEKCNRKLHRRNPISQISLDPDNATPTSMPLSARLNVNSRPFLLPTPINIPPYDHGSKYTAPVFEDFEGTIKHDFIHEPNDNLEIPSLPRTSPYNFEAVRLGSSFNQDGKEEIQFDDSSDYFSKSQSVADSESLLSSSRSCLEAEADIWNPSFPLPETDSLLQSYPVPDEYMVAKVIGGKLPDIKLPNSHTDLLFFLFYGWQGDTTQLTAASLLFDRGWRYHKVEKVWIARWPGVTPEKKTVEWEEGLYQYFDVKAWKRIPGWFRLVYSQLAEKTTVIDVDGSMRKLSRNVFDVS